MSAPHTAELTSINTIGGITTISAQKTGSGVWFHTKRYPTTRPAGPAIDGHQTTADIAVLLDDATAAELGEFVVLHAGSGVTIDMADHVDRMCAIVKRLDTVDIIEAANVGEIAPEMAYQALMDRLHDDDQAKTWLMAYRLGKRDGGAE